MKKSFNFHVKFGLTAFVILCICSFSKDYHMNDTDVVIYGGTPSGIMASISAARMGSNVLLLETTDHIGGVVTNGLTMADLFKRNAYGGLYNEYTQRITEYYESKYGKGSKQLFDCKQGLTPEPHVTEIIFHEMLNNETRIKIYYNHRLTKTLREGNKLVGVIMEDLGDQNKPKNFFAKVFIDATYEGDLAAMAGAKYRVGRESRSEFNERQAGIIYSRFGHDEYLPGSTGKADKAIQAFCFRLSMTSVPKNRAPVQKPEIYNRNEYTSLIEDFKNGLSSPIQLLKRPNNKFEVNSNHPDPVLGVPRISCDLAEENWNYPEATYEEREQIIDRYWNYQLGLIWFLQNDPDIPSIIKDKYKKLGFCKDELITNNNLPRQIYVREARRIEGEYFLTQNDAEFIPEINRTKIQPTSIGISEFPFDSHGCHKYRLEYPGVREGYFYIEHLPFQIPYGVLVPKNVDGLLVSVCVSASHVAFQAIRLEPEYMVLGQVAGIAASLAISSDKKVKDIGVSRLQREYVAQKGIITYFEDIFVDDPDFKAFQFVGLLGEIKGYKANPESIITVSDAANSLSILTNRKIEIEPSERINNLTCEKLLQWLNKLEWNHTSISSNEITVREFVQILFLNYNKFYLILK